MIQIAQIAQGVQMILFMPMSHTSLHQESFFAIHQSSLEALALSILDMKHISRLKVMNADSSRQKCQLEKHHVLGVPSITPKPGHK